MVPKKRFWSHTSHPSGFLYFHRCTIVRGSSHLVACSCSSARLFQIHKNPWMGDFRRPFPSQQAVEDADLGGGNLRDDRIPELIRRITANAKRAHTLLGLYPRVYSIRPGAFISGHTDPFDRRPYATCRLPLLVLLTTAKYRRLRQYNTLKSKYSLFSAWSPRIRFIPRSNFVLLTAFVDAKTSAAASASIQLINNIGWYLNSLRNRNRGHQPLSIDTTESSTGYSL